jgi:hypothetical protein
MSDGYYAINGEENFDDQDENYCGAAIDKLAYYEDAEEQGRLIVLPEDGMLYYIEENEEDKWIGNKPIMDIIFEYGWGLVGLNCSLRDIGKKVFLSREEAESALRGK